jgi:serine/threonine protein kinase/Tol biopolymer transport system component
MWGTRPRDIIRLTMALATGTKLDVYEVIGLLGVGGMGEVYRALDSVLHREVAIKVLPAYVSQDAERLRRFQLEAEAAAALNHPNILAIHYLGVYQGSPYLVSELLQGETLRERTEHGPLVPRKAVDYGIQIARGLAAAQEKGIVHRDLKPENLFVTREGRVKILDFGLAKLIKQTTEADQNATTRLNHGTEPGVVMGTVGYMAPEQVRGEAVDHRADIFAFGAIVYEMLEGKRAFAKATLVDTMSAILHEDPPPLSESAHGTPLGLLRIVHRCLEKSPEQRFQSASDLAFALEALTEPGTSSGAAFVAPDRRTRRQTLMWSSALAVFLVAAIVAYFCLRPGPGPSLRVSDYTQITHSGHAYGAIGADSARLYFQTSVGEPIQQVAITGGDAEPISVAVPNPYLQDVSPDGSTFLVLSYAGGLLPAHPLWSARILGGSLHYLTNASDASWTSDGKSVLYSTPGGNLNLMRSDGTAAHKVASVSSDATSVNLSPDSHTIRYAKDQAFWDMSLDGSNLHEVLPGWRSNDPLRWGRWSADGKFFFFVSGPGRQIWAIDERRGLFRKKPAQPVQLTSGPVRWGPPVPSNDGKTIFTSGSTERGELVRFDPQSKQLQPLLAGISAEFVSFSRDRKWVAYVSFPDGILWKASADGTERVQLSEPPMSPKLLSWSPDGTQILFVNSSPPDHVEAWIVSAQGGTPRRLLPNDAGQQTDPNWSPDGRKIVFADSREAGADRNSSLRMLDVASQQVTTLPGSVGLFSPHWSPDGHFIAAISYDSSSLHLFDTQTQQWSTPYKDELAFPCWSQDSHSIFFLTYRSNPGIFRISSAGGKPERIVDMSKVHTTGQYGLWMGLDPTNAPLLLRDVGTTDIYALTLEQR